MPLPEPPAAAAPPPTASSTIRPAYAYLADSYVYKWDLSTFRTDWFFVLAVAVCLGAGVAAGHPAAGMIAAGGAVTAGFGAKQTIDGSPLLPILFVSFGMGICTFIGMVAGHSNWTLVLIASLFGFGYGMLSKSPAGYGWVGQQCVVTLLVASAFPFGPRAAAARAGLMFAGGIVQLVFSAGLLRAFGQLGDNMCTLASYTRDEEQALRRAYLRAVLSVRQRRLRGSSLGYAMRVAVVLAVSTELYRALHFASGYWIPMTALIVLKPGLTDTASRAIARTLGTLAGAILSSVFLVHIHPPPWGLAGFVLLFTWLAYSLTNVNYALFSVCLTSYIVFLLSLNRMPGPEIAEHRLICTALGGAIALSVRLVVVRLRRNQDEKAVRELLEPELDPARQPGTG